MLAGIALYGYVSWPDVTVLKRKNPATTALMDLRDGEYRKKGQKPVRRQIWAPYDRISDNLKKAILVSEDAAFFGHRGIDYFELKEAIKKDWEKKEFKRGGSTITMQLARNLYLSPSKNPLRKLAEIVIAWQLEHALSKRRIFELYLNVIEWGPGIYGAEAASRHYFAKPASQLSPIEAATLAAILPNPRNPREKGLIYRRNLILARLASVGHISDDDLELARKRPLFGRGEEPRDSVPASEPVVDSALYP